MALSEIGFVERTSIHIIHYQVFGFFFVRRRCSQKFVCSWYRGWCVFLHAAKPVNRNILSSLKVTV